MPVLIQNEQQHNATVVVPLLLLLLDGRAAGHVPVTHEHALVEVEVSRSCYSAPEVVHSHLGVELVPDKVELQLKDTLVNRLGVSSQ